MSKESTLAAITQLVLDAKALAARVSADQVTSTERYETEANDIRLRIKTAIGEVYALWGVRGEPVAVQLRSLAARLVDLRAAVSDATRTYVLTVPRPVSLLELAVELYDDWTRWTELAALNRGLAHPGGIEAGAQVVVYVQ